MKYFTFNKSIYRVAAVLGSMSWTRHKWSLSSNSPAAAAKSVSCVWLCAASLTVAYQAPLSVGFSRQNYCSGLPFPSPGDLSDAGTEPVSLMSPALAGRFFSTSATWEAALNKSISGASAFLLWNGEMTDCLWWFSSVAQSCLTLCDPMNHSTPGLPVHHHLLEFTQTQVHRVRDAVQPCHPRLSPSPPALQSLPASESFPMS